VTVCNSAAGEICPVWPGKPTSAHWGIPDPAAVDGSIEERRRAFHAALQALAARIQSLIALPLRSFDTQALKAALREIGCTRP
jgi:arsenate reductase